MAWIRAACVAPGGHVEQAGWYSFNGPDGSLWPARLYRIVRRAHGLPDRVGAGLVTYDRVGIPLVSGRDWSRLDASRVQLA